MRPLRTHRHALPAAGLIVLALSPGCAGTATGRGELHASATVRAESDGSTAPVERLIELGRQDNRVQDHLRHLTLGIGPRLTGSTNLAEAERWCRDQLASWGLDARLEPWGELAVGFDRGHASGAMVAPRTVGLVFTTPAWSPGTDGPRRGPAVPYPLDEAALEALRPRLAGAWVVRPRGERVSREWRQTVDAALIEAGAAGEVSGGRGDELVHTSGNPRITWEELPRKVEIVLRGDQHDDLVERLGKGEAVELEFDVDNRFVRGPVTLNNVVADLVGAELPDEYVIVCGHLDSWDGAQGAVDNGTGCATTLEAARLLARLGLRPKRTIRFILWSGEEQGLLGSRAYVEQNAELMPRISAVLNHDGGTNWLSGLGATPEMMPQLRAACAPLERLDPAHPFELDEVEALSGMGSSDHAPFVQAGVPGFFWRQSGRSEYDRHHHTQYDTFDAAIPAYQRHSAIVAATVAFGLAEADELLERRNMMPIEPRRLGVQLDGLRVRSLSDDGKAAAAGWQEGDEILAIDGQEVSSRGAVGRALQAGGPLKTIRVRRGEQTLETTLDWSDDPGEAERARRARERAAASGG